jgi:hypothetical protein
MDIKRDFSLAFDEQEYIRLHGERFEQLLKQPRWQAAFQKMLGEIKAVVQPVAVWDRFRIKKIQHDKVVLLDGTKIGGGPVVSVVGGAEDLIAVVCTIGTEADKRIAYYQQNKEMFKALLLDELASWAVDLVRQEVCLWLEKDLQRQGLRSSAPLSPGESTWPVADQQVIFSLLDTAQVGVSLSASMIMYPLKSLSLIMGTGPNPLGVEGATNCDFCSLKDRCNYRRLRVQKQAATV